MAHGFNYSRADSLLQIAEKPIWDGDLISKHNRDVFVEMGWVARCEGYNIITDLGRKAINAMGLTYVKLGD